VAFLGFVAPALQQIAAADALILASEKEGLPRVVLEAMLAGKPVIASNVTGNNELVVDGETGRLYPMGDVASLAQAMAEVAGSEPLRRRWGEAGQRRVRERFSIERYVEGTCSVLAEAAQRKRN
jgi:L-malate glycosyltransferase